ncbi:MAG: hypothetical protein ACR2HO_09030 [Rubrobacteraceae bacterium]
MRSMRGRCGPRRAGFVGVSINLEKIETAPVQGLMGAEIPALGFVHRAWLDHPARATEDHEAGGRAETSGGLLGPVRGSGRASGAPDNAV